MLAYTAQTYERKLQAVTRRHESITTTSTNNTVIVNVEAILLTGLSAETRQITQCEIISSRGR